MSEEEHDLAALNRLTKEMREKRLQTFENYWYDKLLEKVNTIHTIDDGQRYVFTSPKHGTITYYPKANKLLIHNKSKWVKPALKWIIANIIEKL